MKILILGGTGYVGEKLAQALENSGHSVRMASSRKSISSDLYLGTDVVLDCSFPSRHKLSPEIANYLVLLEERVGAIRKMGIPLIYMASMSSSSNSQSRYGRSKFAAEEVVVRGGGFLCRFGILVDFKDPHGIFASLIKFSRLVPVLPRFAHGWFMVNFTLLDDLVSSINERVSLGLWNSFSVVSGCAELCDLVRLSDEYKRIVPVGAITTTVISWLVRVLPEIHPIDSLKSINRKSPTDNYD